MKILINNRLSIFAVGLLFAIMFQSCNVMYSPSMQNTPLLQEKKEVVANIGINDIQGAYAVTDHVGVMLNGYYNNGASNDYSSYDYYDSWSRQERKQWHVEAGAGYFNKLNDNAIVEIFGGLGYGSSSLRNYAKDSINEIPTLKSSYNADLMRFFVQPAIGYSIDNFHVSFSTRILFQKYLNANSFGYSLVELYDDKLLDMDKSVYAFLEPALTLRYGFKYVKFQAQAMLSYKYNVDRLNYMPVVFSIGMHVDIAKRWNIMNRKKVITSATIVE